MDTQVAEKKAETAAYMREYYLAHSTRPRRIPGSERTHKICRMCGKNKSRDEYTVRASGPRTGHLAPYCKPCSVKKSCEAYAGRHSNDDTLYRRVEWPAKLKRLYGITVDDYNRMLLEQGGGCALCGSTNPVVGNRNYKRTNRTAFDVDHCHVTGKVRGLLCTRCNRLVGLANDSAETAMNLVNYLTR